MGSVVAVGRRRGGACERGERWEREPGEGEGREGRGKGERRRQDRTGRGREMEREGAGRRRRRKFGSPVEVDGKGEFMWGISICTAQSTQYTPPFNFFFLNYPFFFSPHPLPSLRNLVPSLLPPRLLFGTASFSLSFPSISSAPPSFSCLPLSHLLSSTAPFLLLNTFRLLSFPHSSAPAPPGTVRPNRTERILFGPPFGPVWPNGGPSVRLGLSGRTEWPLFDQTGPNRGPLVGPVWPNGARGGASAEREGAGRCWGVGRRLAGGCGARREGDGRRAAVLGGKETWC